MTIRRGLNRREPRLGILGLALLAAVLGAGACGNSGRTDSATPTNAATPAGSPLPSSGARRPPGLPRVVVLGDSLTAGLGLPATEAYPAVLQRRIDEAGYRFEVVNAGVSGDTTAGGLSRLEWSLEGDVRVLIVALGGNDGLRGLPPEQMSQNLATIIERAQARRIAVLLAGMESLTNMGPTYQKAFHDAFPALAGRYRVAFLPFLLEGVAGQPALNQNDGIHPTAEGARMIAAHLWPLLEPLLQAASR